MKKTTRTKALPPLPDEVLLPAGPYRVVRAIPECEVKEGDCVYGLCDTEARIITVRPGLSRIVAHMTLEHELVHAILFDAGVRLPEQKEEAVADAISNYRVFERQH